MKFHVRLFGVLQELTGQDVLELECQADTISLIQEATRVCPNLNSTRFVIAVDLRIVHEKTDLTEQSDVALLPPFSGG